MNNLIKFDPRNFGGYTLSLLLAGLFIGYTKTAWWYIIASFIMWGFSLYFYAKAKEVNK